MVNAWCKYFWQCKNLWQVITATTATPCTCSGCCNGAHELPLFPFLWTDLIMTDLLLQHVYKVVTVQTRYWECNCIQYRLNNEWFILPKCTSKQLHVALCILNPSLFVFVIKSDILYICLTFKTMFTCTERHRKPTKVIITHHVICTLHESQHCAHCWDSCKVQMTWYRHLTRSRKWMDAKTNLSHFIKNFHASYHTKKMTW